MARTKAALGSGARLADHSSASLMAQVVPPQVVHEVLDANGRNSLRIRAFPAVAGVLCHGAQPLADLVQRCCVPIAEEAIHPSAFYRGIRLVAFDGSTFELADDPQIEQAFGRPGGRQGPVGATQARCIVLAERATHASR